MDKSYVWNGFFIRLFQVNIEKKNGAGEKSI